MGSIIRDHRGKTILAAGKILSNNQNIEEVDMIARLEGACIAAYWDRCPVILKSDCSQIITDITT
jgi:hypothetical protein